MFPWNIAKSAEAMLSRWAVKRVCKFVLKKKLGKFILGDIDLDQLDVQLSAGTLQLSDLALNVDYLNQKLGAKTAFNVKEGSIGSLLVTMPWKWKAKFDENLWPKQEALLISRTSRKIHIFYIGLITHELWIELFSSSYRPIFDLSLAQNMQRAKDHVLNMSPRPSQQLNSPTNMARILYEYAQSPLCEDSEKDRCVDHIGSVPPNGAIDSFESSVELMKEIAILEVEILHMEHYLLSLYRKAFRHQLQPLSQSCVVDSVSKVTSTLSSPKNSIYIDMSHNKLQGRIEQNNQESHSHGLPGLYEKSEMLSNSSSRKEKLRSDSCHRSLADHLSASRVDDSLKSPDKLSEEIVRCISSIYCRLADPRPAEKEFAASSSSSSTSSSSIYTPKNLSGSWSPCHNEEGRKHHEAQNVGKRYEMTMEIIKLCLDDASYQYASMMLQKFRSLVKILEKVDPRKMKREEKLTFWINIHNALVMHAYLAYGTRNYITNTTILKAAYNVGGYFINAYEIQSSILGIRSHYSAPWLQLFLSPGKKLLTGNTKHPYQIEYPEPLVHFALCSGSYSDPVLRVYRAKNVFEDLKVAQQEFIRSNVDVTKEKQIHLPKVLSYFAKDMSLNMVALHEMVGAHLPEVQQKASTMDRLEKHTYWLQRISTFRYLIHKDVMQGMYL